MLLFLKAPVHVYGEWYSAVPCIVSQNVVCAQQRFSSWQVGTVTAATPKDVQPALEAGLVQPT